YAIGLTDIEPLKYGLIFERFLNLERFTPPDIDVDFMGDRRDEVIQYVTQKYGADRVAQIGTFNTMLARAAVRDVARVLGMPYGEADRVGKTMPCGLSSASAGSGSYARTFRSTIRRRSSCSVPERRPECSSWNPPACAAISASSSPTGSKT